MNPYAENLGQRNADEVISQTPERLRKLLADLGSDGLKRSYAPGKWNAAAILIHLADCEIAFAFRLRQTLAETDHTIQPFDQDAWARLYGSSAFDPSATVELFSALRRWNIAFLDAAGPESRFHPVTHPERGGMTLQTIVETMGGHDLNHLRQLETIAGAKKV